MCTALHTSKALPNGWCALVAVLVSLAPAFGQRYEISPIVGARFGGTMELEQTGRPNFTANIADSITYGVAGGFRFFGEYGEGYDVVEFRWMRQSSHLGTNQDPLATTPGATFRPSITLNHFLGDFTHEFNIQEAQNVSPFITGTLGAVHMSAPASSATRFAFGIGGGVKVFPARHWGFRVKVEYLPTVMYSELQKLVCAGGCVVVLNGGVMSQFEVSIGPSFRF